MRPKNVTSPQTLHPRQSARNSRQMNPRPVFEELVESALRAVCPVEAILSHVRRRGSKLRVDREIFDLARFDEIRLIAVGKAAVPMAATLIPMIGDKLSKGVIVTKKGYFKKPAVVSGKTISVKFDQRMTVIESGHPLPDRNSLRAGRAIADTAANCSRETLVLCCISGGASALAILPKPGISLASYRDVNKILLASGADIMTVNGIRKALDRIKGGGLAQMAQPAQVVSLIISDVMGDPIPIIASGPTHHPRARNFLIANNAQACRAAAIYARKSGFKTRIVTTELRGEAKKAGAQIAQDIAAAPPKTCLIYGGESTVTLKGKTGKGGRNQELVLAAAIALSKSGGHPQIALVSFGTDGIDGMSNAAGAFCTPETVAHGKSKGLSAQKLLREHNSHIFFKAIGQLITTGQTGTNVADVVVAVKF